MRQGALSAQQVSDLVWLCRRLAADLEGDLGMAAALDRAAQEAATRLGPLVAAMRDSFCRGDRAARGLTRLGYPSWVWRAMLSGELQAKPLFALTALGDRLEVEAAMPPGGNQRLRAYFLGLGRLAMLAQVGVPLSQAVEAAGDALPTAEARAAFAAAKAALEDGRDLSEALAAAPGMPPLVTEMVRDAERDGDLGRARAVAADYLADEAGLTGPRKEAKHG